MIKNLRILRQKKGISQQQLADVLGISQQSVNKYENHNIEPDIATLITLSDYFGVSVDYLIGKNADMEENGIFSDDEEYILRLYRKLEDNEKNCVKTVLETFNKR